MRALTCLTFLVLLHTSTLWSPSERLAGSMGDTLAHASLPQWFCRNVVMGDLHLDRFLAPWGADAATNYDSPFPLILTCPLVELGGPVQFHFFVFLQICLIVIGAWSVARQIFPANEVWQVAYVLFVWFTGFYFAQSLEHFTLFSGIWGFQFVLWSALTANPRSRANMSVRGLFIGLVFAGTFHNLAMLAIPVLALGAWAVYRQWPMRNVEALNLLISAAIAFIVIGVLFAPAIHAYITQDLVSTSGVRGLYSADLIGLFIPSITSRLYYWAFEVVKVPFSLITHFERINSMDILVWIPLFASLGIRKFWRQSSYRILAGLAVLFFFLSLGPVVEFQETALFANPLNWLLNVFPLSLSRTPGRLLLVTVLALTFIAFCASRDLWARKKWFNGLGLGVIFWALLTGPGLNDTPFVRTTEIDAFLPRNALNIIRDSTLGKIVGHIPAAPIADASQNFLQLYHGKPITAGYLAYTAYTGKKFDWPLEGLNPCSSTLPIVPATPELIRNSLIGFGIRHLIVNRDLIMDPTCESVVNWTNSLAGVPWIHKIGENAIYSIFEIR